MTDIKFAVAQVVVYTKTQHQMMMMIRGIASRSRSFPQSLLNSSIRRLNSNFIVVQDESTVHAAVEQPSKKIFYFTASWCPPCRKIAPIYEKLSKDNQEISFYKIDIDEFPDFAAKYKISSVPTFIFSSGGSLLSAFSGANEGALTKNIQDLRDHK